MSQIILTEFSISKATLKRKFSMYGGSQRRRKSNVSDPRKMSFRRQSGRRGTMAMDTRKSRILKLNEQFQATARKKV